MARQRARSNFPFEPFILAQVVVALLGARYAGAQLPAATADQTNSTPAGISIPDAPEAVDLLGKAADAQSLKDWNSAADAYLKAIRRFRDRVVPLNAGAGIRRYVGVEQAVQERLAKWPTDGLSVYTNLYGGTAADRLAAASRDDVAAVGEVFWTYFATDAGRQAGVRLMDHYFDDGDFRAAAWIGGRLLSFHPNLANDRAAILYRTALAWHFAGEDAEAKKLLEQLKAINAGDNSADQATIAGLDVALADALSTALVIAPPSPTTRPWDADEHPSFDEQNDVQANASTAKPLALARTIALNKPNYAGVGPALLKNLLASDQQELATHMGCGIIPATDGGDLFFQDGRTLYAIDLATGGPIPEWAATYPQQSGCCGTGLFGRARDQMLTVTVSPTSVVAIMGQPDRSPLLRAGMIAPPAEVVGSSNRLVCLDRDTGRQRWTQTPADLPDRAAHLRSFEYTGTPLIVPANLLGGQSADDGDALLVTARGGSESEFDYCYVVCFSCKTGAYRWSTYLGGGRRNGDVGGNNVVQTRGDPSRGRPPQGTASQMAFAEGRVFVMTNLGAIAAIDPVEGRPIWFDLYAGWNSPAGNAAAGDAASQSPPIDATGSTGSHRPWSLNPVFVRDGNVFFLPRDSDKLFICDSQSGLPRGSLSMSDWQNASSLLGIQGNALIVSGDKSVAAIDWRKALSGSAEQATLWSADIAFDDDASVCGRGVVTDRSVLIPTTQRLVRIVNGRIRATYPAHGSFGTDRARGNLLATGGQVVVTGAATVDVYCDASASGSR